jgi:4-amino-4-deoxy-L-arabinose transferase-like glycosyltransferase
MLALAGTLLVTALRLALLPFYETGLGPDEAQYWFWAQDLAFGYYSKPPVIAWIIALPTALFGDHEWSVRLLSPLLIGGTGLLLFASARRLYGSAPALFTLALWHLTPAVMLGATLVTTDVPLLLCWSLALYAFVRMTEAEARPLPWALLLGTALGLGLLSKYAMVYFPVGLALAAALSARVRRPGLLPYLVAGTLGLLIFLPNVLWNLRNGMQTVGHTADNASWAGTLRWGELGEFAASQLGVFGPLTFLALLAYLLLGRRWVRRAGAEGSADAMLAALILPPLLLICVQALLSRAHANWAMTAYPAALVLLPAWLLRLRQAWVLWASAALHAVAGLAFTIVLLHLPLADALGLSNAVKRLRGWDETAVQVLAAVQAGGHDALLLDDRELAAHLVWELRDEALPIRVLDPNGRLDNTYEIALPLREGEFRRYLLVTQNPVTLPAYDRFGTILPVGEAFVDLRAERRGRRERTLDLYAVGG